MRINGIAEAQVMASDTTLLLIVVTAASVGVVAILSYAVVARKIVDRDPAAFERFFRMAAKYTIPVMTVGMVVTGVIVLGLANVLHEGALIAVISSIVGFTLGVGAAKRHEPAHENPAKQPPPTD
jgi:uncharacterized membrane protein